MILSDTDILSALAKVNQLDLLFTLLAVEQIHIVPAVLTELEAIRVRQLSFAQKIFGYIESQRIGLLIPTETESAFAESLPMTLGTGERESIAVAYHLSSVLLSNESRVAHWSHRLKIEFLDLPLLLRALWTESILTQQEVRQLISDLYTYDNMSISVKNIAAIFAPQS